MSKKRIYLIIAVIIIGSITALAVVSGKKKCLKVDYAVCNISIDNNKLKLKIAYSKKAQEQGLMWVESLEDGTGMIFVYDKPQYLTFWMKNTIIPLSIAFVEADGKISVIYDMYPQPGRLDSELTIYPSPTQVQYAIEAPVGWFALKNIKRNSYVNIPAQLW
ncbi:MAG: DUF192 domain-containing protein [bacterium]